MARRRSLRPSFVRAPILFSRRSRRRRTRRYYGFEGFEGSRRRSRYLSGDRKSGIGDTLLTAVSVTGGAVGGSVIAGMVPGIPSNLKPLVAIAGGVALNAIPATRKSAVARNVGIGMTVAGILSLIRQYAPQVPLLTGEVEDDLQPVSGYLGAVEEPAESVPEISGTEELDELLGVPAELSADVHVSPADV